MENNPLYRLYLQLNDRVDKLSTSGNVGSGGSADLSDVIVRIRDLENRPSVDGVIHELSKTVEVLKNENQELKSKLESLNKFENIEARLYHLECEPKVSVEPLTTRVNALESNDFNSRISQLESRVPVIEELNNQIPDLTYRISDLERRPDLSQRLNALETTVSNLNLQGETPQ